MHLARSGDRRSPHARTITAGRHRRTGQPGPGLEAPPR
jgi:hypothetical protein